MKTVRISSLTRNLRFSGNHHSPLSLTSDRYLVGVFHFLTFGAVLITARVRSTTGSFDTHLSFHQSVCPRGGGGGYPYPIMLCNISQNAMGQTPGGGVPISHNALQHFPECHGADTWGGVPCQVQPGGYSARSSRGVPCWGGYPARGYPPGQVRTRGYPALGGTQVGYPPGQVRRGGTLPGGGGVPS